VLFGPAILNIGTGEDFTIADFARLVADSSAVAAGSNSTPQSRTLRRASCSTTAINALIATHVCRFPDAP
jgi:hypothetical protein